MGFSKVSEDAWVLAATGEIGDVIHWEEPFQCIAKVIDILAGLEDVGDAKKIDWKALLGDRPYFKEVPEINYPPFYDVRDLQDAFSDFLVIAEEDEDDEDNPGMDFLRVRVYVDRDRMDTVLAEFQGLLTALQANPQLIKAGLV